MAHKSGFVSIIGKPNVGKSTILNSLLGEKLSIATSKPQTTRKRILGILSSDDYQIIFLDTPGILNPEYLLQKRMLEIIDHSIMDSDLLLLMIDLENDSTGSKTFEDERVQKFLKENKFPKILLLNKIDVSNQKTIETISENVLSSNYFKKVIPVSALEKTNIQTVIDSILEYLPVHPKYYPDDQLSDEHERFFVSEIIREKIFELYRDEIPYSTEVEIEEFSEKENRKDYIRAAIIIERDSQKPIIIGEKGLAIKKLGKLSRQSIESFLQREVFLELFVKVKEKWRSNPGMLNRFGYKVDGSE